MQHLLQHDMTRRQIYDKSITSPKCAGLLATTRRQGGGEVTGEASDKSKSRRDVLVEIGLNCASLRDGDHWVVVSNTEIGNSVRDFGLKYRKVCQIFNIRKNLLASSR